VSKSTFETKRLWRLSQVIIGAAVLSLAAVKPAMAAGVVATPANNFLNSIGVNIHDDQIQDDSSYTAPFQYSAIRNARAGLRRSAGQVTLHNATKVAGVYPGVMFNILFYGGTDIPTDISDAKTDQAAGALLSIEGPNEPNNQPFTYDGALGGGITGTSTWLPVAEFQRDVYAAVKADPVLGTAGANIPVFTISEPGAEADNVGLQFLTIPAGSGLSMPDGTKYADYANVHNYTSLNADNNTWNNASPNEPGPSDGMASEYFGFTWLKGYAALPLGSTPIPMVSTEFGGTTSSSDTSSPLTQDQQGKLALNQFCSQFKRGFKYSFWYEMRDNEGGNAGFGLFDSSNNPKLAGTYLHNLNTILADESSFTPGSLNYTIPSEPATVHDMLLQKTSATGTFYLVVWDDRPVAEGTDPVTVNLGGTYAVSEYDPTVGTSATSLGNISSVSLTLSDHPVILAISAISQIPPVPTGLTATPGNAQVSLSWMASSGALNYNVLRSTTSNGTYTIISMNQSSTSFVNTGLTNGTTYYYEVNAVNSSGTSANTSPVSATPSGGSNLPAGQTDMDIGGSLPAGTGNDSGGVYTLTGGGANIWGTSDQFNYVYQRGSNDETIVTRVTGLSGTNLNASAKAGIMFRDSTAANAIFVDVDYLPSSTGVGRVEFLYRAATGASASYVPGINVNVAPLSKSKPVWLKLVKSGTTYTAYYSTSVTTPTTWTLVNSTTPSVTVSMTNNSSYLTGLDVCSLNNGTSVTGTFDNVSMLPTGKTDVDIGGSLPAGSGNYINGVYTLTGGGSDIWGTADQFNYVYQSGSGDETLIARVTGLSGTSLNANAKAGIQFRDSTATGAIFVDVDYEPTGGGHVEFLYRSSTGAAASYVPGVNVGVAAPSTTTPVWIKLVKSGTTYTGYYSTSVTTPTWNLIGSITVSMTNNSSYLTGLDVCSHNSNTALVMGTFDNISP